ncbi:hypothetical protein NDU88_004047 [Pleurodeles waltl]|uniref:Uncharacterized protein n=1 Tax=Pleurodeles waltl TaxID=8319 RepID=A0AAV7V1V2_PLEWA|nr:hypothetical protein NDU88_004047 [Pleurodeles waltl]
MAATDPASVQLCLFPGRLPSRQQRLYLVSEVPSMGHSFRTKRGHPSGGMRSSLTGALRRSVQQSRAACRRTRPALCTPGSPPVGQRTAPAHTTGSWRRALTSLVATGSE